MIEAIDIRNLEKLNNFLKNNSFDSIQMVELENNPFMKIFIYHEDGKILGYLNYSIIYDKAELNQILVDVNFRKKGLGSKLLKWFLNDCRFCEDITLEVKEDNMSAIRLYKKFGFKSVAIRKNYYGNVNGLLMIYKRGE